MPITPSHQLELDLTKASNHWGKEIQTALNEKFGKDKVGFMLVLTTSGEGGIMTLKTSLKLSGCVAFLRELANKVAHGMKGEILQ